MTDQLSPADESAPSEGAFDPPSPTRMDKVKSEIVAGGASTERSDDELAGGWRGALAMAIILALFVWLGFANIWIFVFIVGVVISIFLHELGHFMTARWTGMKATQFFLFFGPRLWSFRRGETEYGVRAIPLGAFVRIVGMHRVDDVDPADEARTYRQQSFPKRLLVISAGSIMHVIIAIVLFFGVYATQGELGPPQQVFVEEAASGFPAGQAGIEAGDEVLSVGGIEVSSSRDLVEAVQSFRPADVVDIVVVRDGTVQTYAVELASWPDAPAGSELADTAFLGVSSDTPTVYQDHSIGAAAVNSVTDVFPAAWESVRGVIGVLNPINIVEHVTGESEDLRTRPTTLYGVATVSDDVGEASGLAGVLFVLAILNVFVGVFNMFPLLPLDGGHAAIAVYERVQEWRMGTRRYFADVERLMPFAMAVIMVLASLLFAGLYLDITDPIG